jgi:hypothetical protein
MGRKERYRSRPPESGSMRKKSEEGKRGEGWMEVQKVGIEEGKHKEKRIAESIILYSDHRTTRK